MKGSRVSLSKPYIDGIDLLINEGFYESRPETVKDALRRLFKHYDLDVAE